MNMVRTNRLQGQGKRRVSVVGGEREISRFVKGFAKWVFNDT